MKSKKQPATERSGDRSDELPCGPSQACLCAHDPSPPRAFKNTQPRHRTLEDLDFLLSSSSFLFYAWWWLYSMELAKSGNLRNAESQKLLIRVNNQFLFNTKVTNVHVLLPLKTWRSLGGLSRWYFTYCHVQGAFKSYAEAASFI